MGFRQFKLADTGASEGGEVGATVQGFAKIACQRTEGLLSGQIKAVEISNFLISFYDWMTI
jgi:hypothetical protein